MNDHRIIGNTKPPGTIDRTLVDKLNEEAAREKRTKRLKRPEEIADTGSEEAGYFILEDIACVGCEDEVFERYDRIGVATDVVRKDGQARIVTQEEAVDYFGAVKDGPFLPSLPLQCAILAKLYELRNDPAADAILRQYRSHGESGRHHSNTIIKYEQIINYPRGYYNVSGADPNRDRQYATARYGHETTRRYEPLRDALQDEAKRKDIRKLTGLQDPAILEEIGAYLGTTTRFLSAEPVGTNIPWIGYTTEDLFFQLIASGSKTSTAAFRGVKVLEARR